MAGATCRYCETPVGDAPACINCGALIAPQWRDEWAVLQVDYPPPPNAWRLTGLISLTVLSLAMEGVAIVWLFRLAVRYLP